MTTAFVRKLASGCVSLCILMATCQMALRADVTGSILGTVRDASGAAIPNVSITATNLETNLTQKATSDTSGAY